MRHAIATGETVNLEVDIFPVHVERALGERLQIGITLVRADQAVGDTRATLGPATRVLLPLSDPADIGFTERTA